MLSRRQLQGFVRRRRVLGRKRFYGRVTARATARNSAKISQFSLSFLKVS
jgi:hypothetical protein